MVPIPVIMDSSGADMAEEMPAASLDVGAWIEPPLDGGKSYWVLESKVTDTYALMYYSSMPRIERISFIMSLSSAPAGALVAAI